MPDKHISAITLPNQETYSIKDANALHTNGVLGDLIYWSDTNTPSNLSIGTYGLVLKSNGNTPTWEDEYKIEIVTFMEAT